MVKKTHYCPRNLICMISFHFAFSSIRTHANELCNDVKTVVGYCVTLVRNVGTYIIYKHEVDLSRMLYPFM